MCVYMYLFESFSNIKLILLKYTIHIVIILVDFLIQNNSKIGSAFIEKKRTKIKKEIISQTIKQKRKQINKEKKGKTKYLKKEHTELCYFTDMYVTFCLLGFHHTDDMKCVLQNSCKYQRQRLLG